MRIRDITLDEIRNGKNWKLVNPQEVGEILAMEDLSIAECEDFRPEDYVVYSAIFVTDSGEVQPFVMIKEVGDIEYGGDMCEFVGGKWQQMGLVPNPDAPFGTEYYANPLAEDPSFYVDEEQDDKAYHRKGFKQWAVRL